MTDWLFSLLSQEYGGLVLAIVAVLFGVIVWRLSHRWHWKAVAGTVTLAALVLATGAASHLVRHSAREAAYPPPGAMVDVGGYRLHVLAEGPTAGPTIVWLAGGHVGGLPMFQFHAALRDETRSVLIDRPGTGWSEAGPFPRTTAVEAEEVIRALEGAGEEGPYIFAGHSFGGLLAANIARRYPDLTASVVMLDATPLDIIFYGVDRSGLAGFRSLGLNLGLRHAFGFYGSLPETPPATRNSDGLVEIEDPMALRNTISATPRFGLAAYSIFDELTPEGLIPRAHETVVYDGELGAIPVYLVAPGEDPTTEPYAAMVTDSQAKADRFVAFLKHSRERYLDMSSNSKRIYAPSGTGHVFPDQEPQWLIDTMREIVAETEQDWQYRQLTTLWPGPFGGVPPVDIATPESVESAYLRALEEKRAQVETVANNTQPASFTNTYLALEDSGLALGRVQALLSIFSATVDDPAYKALHGKLAPLHAALEDEIVQNEKLFMRLDTVYQQLPELDLDAQDARLVSVVHDKFVRGGAALDTQDKLRLKQINTRLAELRSQFVQNTVADEASLVVSVNSEAELSGMPESQIAAAKAAAVKQGYPERWSIPIKRPSVWPVLTNADNRELRQQVWQDWATRGGNTGANDNRPIVNEILALRGEKAQLMGYPSFAHYQTSARMAGSPEAAMTMMTRTWNALREPTAQETRELMAIAAQDGVSELEPWDRLYYAEKLRVSKFDFDAESIKPYFSLDNVIRAMTWAAAETYQMEFEEIEDIPAVSPDIRVFKVSREGSTLGLIYMDLLAREGKQPASWASQYRSHETFRGKQLPLVVLHSAAQKSPDGGPVLVPWERANVIFHEFGHTLHTLSYQGTYPSLNSLAAPWDFIEVPSLLNERWLADRSVLQKFMTHYETGESMPESMMDRLEQVNQYNRVFSVNFNFLASALVDMRLHLLADGREINAVEVEKQVIEELAMPPSIDLTLYVPHAFHTFSKEYAAALYTYLWSDAIAADAAEAFLQTPDGLFDQETALLWRKHILEAGNTLPIDEAYRHFRGNDPDPDALLRRFDLLLEEEQ